VHCTAVNVERRNAAAAAVVQWPPCAQLSPVAAVQQLLPQQPQLMCAIGTASTRLIVMVRYPLAIVCVGVALNACVSLTCMACAWHQQPFETRVWLHNVYPTGLECGGVLCQPVMTHHQFVIHTCADHTIVQPAVSTCSPGASTWQS
jgi:hypothetical protein